MSVRLLLTDEAWAEIVPILATLKSRAGSPPALSARLFIEALLSLARTGTPWRDLPEDFGHWDAVYNRFRRWEARGIWRRLWECLQVEHCPLARHLFIDATIVRAHQHAAGALKKTADKPHRLWAALGGGLSTKIHAGCLDERTGVACVLTAGQGHARPVCEAVLAQVPTAQPLTHAIMDKGYDSNPMRAQLVAHAMVPVLPSRSNRTAPLGYDKALYKLREKVERFFNNLKQFRRIATRYEKLSQTFLALIHLVAVWIIIK